MDNIGGPPPDNVISSVTPMVTKNMATEKSNSHEMRILLIEDDTIDYKSIKRALRYSNYSFELDHISRISEVKSLLSTSQYDIIITDMNLPDSNGLDTIHYLLHLINTIPIVVLSGTNDDEIAFKAVHAGAQDYIPKQYISDANLINRTLRHAIERHQLKIGLEATRDREKYLAHYDQCTALPNRTLFLNRINQTITQAKRNNDKFSLFFIDLDRFKNINDSIGHSAGDEILRCVGQRILQLTRKSDTVARFGGDEFVLILQKSENASEMQTLAEKIIQSINQPIFYGYHQCSIGASIGIACYPRHGHSTELLIKNADIAMYESKNKGRNQVQFFSQQLFDQKNNFFIIEKALREALHDPDQYFELHYQPRIELLTGLVHSTEALLRWRHTNLSNISPSIFIPLAEDLGLIEKIDAWVLDTACKKALEWKNQNRHIQISVNISGYSFNKYDLMSDLVKNTLEKYQLKGDCLEIEITERVLLSDTLQVGEHLKYLKTLGVSLAIDDFGTGFSSLSYLNKFPIDTLKIDGSFICDKTSNQNDQLLLKAIIDLGQTLQMKVVAECIETIDQKKYISELSCHEGQGYFWGKPNAQWIPDKKAS